MSRLCIAVIGVLTFVRAAYSAAAVTVTVNTESAKAVLVALENPSLTHEEALEIARMTGNQGIIRTQNEFKISVTNDSFANALWAAAHGQMVTDPTETALYFDIVQPKAAKLLALTNEIEANPQAFRGSIEKRIALFTPPGSEIHLQGYIVAGGDGGGYAFGGTEFYLNLEFNDDMAVAKTATTHELYHAVQGAFAGKPGSAVEAPAQTLSHAQRACANIAHLFADNEAYVVAGGVAVVVAVA
jgi:pyruvate/2-oxoacid:ferredoxin oxidoreductase beta subunit